MNRTPLRIYYGPQDDISSKDVAKTGGNGESVTVPLPDVLTLLLDAVRSERTWLRDFKDDEITISMDLYEVLLAYQYYRRPSA